MGLLDKNKKSETIKSYRGHNFEIINLGYEAMGINGMNDDLFIQIFNKYPIEAFIGNTIPGYDIEYDDSTFKMVNYLKMKDYQIAQYNSKVAVHDYHFTVKGERFKFYVGIDEKEAKCDY